MTNILAYNGIDGLSNNSKMENGKDLSKSMQETVEFGNLGFLEDYGEIIIDSALDEGLLKEIPVFGTLFGISKCVRNVYDVMFAKKLITFLVGIKDVDSRKREQAISKWEKDTDYQIKVGETLIGMIQRCDDNNKAKWLSKLFCELVLKRNDSLMFMRTEKILSSLSVMDVLSFLKLPSNEYEQLNEVKCEPFICSGLYLTAAAALPQNGVLDLSNRVCRISMTGLWIYCILNGIDVPELKNNKLV